MRGRETDESLRRFHPANARPGTGPAETLRKQGPMRFGTFPPKRRLSMNHDAQTTLQGEVADIFAHRFVVKTGSNKVLADLTPKGAEQIALHKGDRVMLSGEMKPSELKV